MPAEVTASTNDERHAGRGRTDDGVDALTDQTRGLLGRDRGVTGLVTAGDRDVVAEHPASRVDVGDGELDGLDLRGAEEGERTGLGEDVPELQRAVTLGGRLVAVVVGGSSPSSSAAGASVSGSSVSGASSPLPHAVARSASAVAAATRRIQSDRCMDFPPGS
jgi:hypothetical protein